MSDTTAITARKLSTETIGLASLVIILLLTNLWFFTQVAAYAR